MQIALLYATVVLIWGTTWFAIELQLGTVPVELSVAYRFGLASICLILFGHFTGRDLRIPATRYPMVVLMGALLFSASYLCVYHGTGYLTSGLVAVMFGLIIPCNALLERFVFRTPIDMRLGLAAATGLLGIALVFWPELHGPDPGSSRSAGMAWVLTGVLFASLGNMAAMVNTRHGLPVVTVNAHAMAWGALTSVVIALLAGRPILFLAEPTYVTSLLFLAIFGSSVAFGCYLALLERIGSARASYSSVLYPVVALLVSTMLEDFRWTAIAVAGVFLILAGNWLALVRPRAAH